MKVVHTAATDVEAVMLQGLLEEAGIPVMLRGRRTPPHGDAVELAVSFGGDLLVPDDRAEDARELVAGYLASLKNDNPS